MLAGTEYLETHISIEDSQRAREYLMRNAKLPCSCSLSNTEKMLVTLRSYTGYASDHMRMVGKRLEMLAATQIPVNKAITEWCWYDTNVKHDSGWLEGSK